MKPSAADALLLVLLTDQNSNARLQPLREVGDNLQKNFTAHPMRVA